MVSIWQCYFTDICKILHLVTNCAPPVSIKVKQRRTHLPGHCLCHVDDIAKKLVLKPTTKERASKGKKT